MNPRLGHRRHPITDSTNKDPQNAVSARKNFLLRRRQARVSVLYFSWAPAPASPCDMPPGSPGPSVDVTGTQASVLTSGHQ
jgi:hypothetical protein